MCTEEELAQCHLTLTNDDHRRPDDVRIAQTFYAVGVRDGRASTAPGEVEKLLRQIEQLRLEVDIQKEVRRQLDGKMFALRQKVARLEKMQKQVREPLFRAAAIMRGLDQDEDTASDE